MIGRKAAVAAALWICCAGALSSSAPFDEADLKSRQERAEREWPGRVQQSVKVTAEHCANAQVPTKVLSPELLYRGSINDVAASITGAVAIADIKRGFVLVFDNAERIGAPRQIPLGSGFSDHSLGFSEDGRYLAWATPFETYIYDLHARQFALVLGQFGARQMQWIGDDLLVIGNDSYNMNFTTTSLIRLANGAFHREVLDTLVFGKGHIPPGASEALPYEDNPALADQLGKSFLSTKKGVYPSFEAAIHDGADISLHKNTIYSGRVYRVGERLLQPSNNENLFLKPDVPWSLLLRDGTNGNVIKSVSLPMPWCVPDQLAVAGDQSQIAMLTRLSVLILDPTDLTVRTIYGLDAPTVALPQSIALAPGNTLIVWADSLNPNSSSVLVYRLDK